MTILVTGATGKLGSAIVNYLNANGFDVFSYSHTMSLHEMNWNSISTIVNCAAVTPAENVTDEKYIEGNVVFLQNLLKYSSGKNFIHFSTFSELYKNDFYQFSKMMANSLLLINSKIFNKLSILPLPTSVDQFLLQSIGNTANSGLVPRVDRLKYNYMSYASVASFVKEEICRPSFLSISKLYEERDLYTEVSKRICESKFLEGKVIDRTLLSAGVYNFSPELLSTLKSKGVLN